MIRTDLYHPMSQNPINETDEVYRFCKDNNIEIGWDQDSIEVWNEILLDGRLVIQVQSDIKLSQFLNAIRLMAKDYNTQEFPDEFEDFWIRTGNEKRFNEFVERHAQVLGIEK